MELKLKVIDQGQMSMSSAYGSGNAVTRSVWSRSSIEYSFSSFRLQQIVTYSELQKGGATYRYLTSRRRSSITYVYRTWVFIWSCLNFQVNNFLQLFKQAQAQRCPKYVGPLYCRAEMYAGRVARCPTGESRFVCRRDRQTDRQTGGCFGMRCRAG